MKFKSAILSNFKCFTKLTVQNMPETVRLIILIGPNGCGKSSFMDALKVWNSPTSVGELELKRDYYRKEIPPKHHVDAKVDVNFHDSFSHIQNKEKALHIRSSYRNDPKFETKEQDYFLPRFDRDKVYCMADNDVAVFNNYQKIVEICFEEFFADRDDIISIRRPRENILWDIRRASLRLFPDLQLNDLKNPFSDGTFRFTKGDSRGFSFKNLSGGEKAAFDLILDLVVARGTYDDTVFCIDEPESHMNAKLQADLLSVLYDLIPENCQLMLATHSIGMMRRARDIEKEHPGSVAFLDFGDRDFDKPQVIEPTIPDRGFWNKAYGVALDDLAALVAPERVVICEGEPVMNRLARNHSLDADCYNRIFERKFPETRFVSMGNDRQIVGDQRGLAETLGLLVGGLEIVRLIDRDDQTDNEIADRAEEGVRVLSWRNLESYLFNDEVLRALAVSVGKEDKADELLVKKQDIRDARPGDRADDLKPASGELYVACKDILKLTRCGNDAKSFMRDTLAPLIKPGMTTYERLKRDIFGPRTDS